MDATYVLYVITWETETYYVIAKDMENAMKLWRTHVDLTSEDDPTSITELEYCDSIIGIKQEG